MSNLDERAIQATDVDAVEAKASAVKLGYWKDPYIRYFINEPKSKAPEINRGYFARTQSIEAITKSFITQNKQSQIINVGSGSDTLYFRLLSQNVLPNKFIEIDLQENILKKVSQFHQRKIFKEKLKMSMSDKFSETINQDPYFVFPFDLRSDPNEFIDILKRDTNINLSFPTLFIAECVLIYINSEMVDRFLFTMADNFPLSVFLSYDPVNMGDAFGRVMVYNLKMRHIELNGISSCMNKESHIERFRKCNYHDVKIWLISEVYKSFSKQTTKRIESIEMLDDPEMMKQLFDHYCLIVAMTKPELLKFDNITDMLSIIE